MLKYIPTRPIRLTTWPKGAMRNDIALRPTNDFACEEYSPLSGINKYKDKTNGIILIMNPTPNPEVSAMSPEVSVYSEKTSFIAIVNWNISFRVFLKSHRTIKSTPYPMPTYLAFFTGINPQKAKGMRTFAEP